MTTPRSRHAARLRASRRRAQARARWFVLAVAPQPTEGLLARLWQRITGSTRRGFAWYQLEGGALRTLDVGAVAGTDVYSPVDGTVVSIREQVISGRPMGSQIELQPSSAP